MGRGSFENCPQVLGETVGLRARISALLFLADCVHVSAAHANTSVSSFDVAAEDERSNVSEGCAVG